MSDNDTATGEGKLSAPERVSPLVSAEAEPKTVVLKVDSPFYMTGAVLPDGEDEHGNALTLTVTRDGTEVPADRADELIEAAAALGVNLTRSE